MPEPVQAPAFCVDFVNTLDMEFAPADIMKKQS